MMEEIQVRNGYKMTELGEIPVEWEVRELDEIVEKIVGGGTPSRENSSYYIGDIPWFTVKDMDGSFYKCESQEYINKQAIKESSSNLIDANNVIIATRIALGRGFINTRKIAINQDLKGLYLDKNKIIPPFFLFSYLKMSELIANMGSGSTVKGIRLELLKKFKFLIPPISEQQKIAEILSTVDEQIENTEQLIEKTKELKKGLMQQLLTKGIGHTEFKETELGKIPVEWEVKKLRDICDVRGGKRIPKGKSLLKENTGQPYIRVTDMYMGGISLANILYVPFDIQHLISNYRIYETDLFISVAGTLGIVGEIPIELNGANLTENANKLCDIKINKKFLKWYLLSNFIQNEIESEKTQNAQPKLALIRIKNFKLPIPPLPEQQKIASILSSVDEQIESYEAEKEKYVELKKGLMQQLLTGKMRVKI